MNNGKVCVNTGGGGAPNICSSSNYNDGQWHHAVGIKNDGCIELYVDNQFEGQVCSGWTFGYDVADTGDDYYIGDNRSTGSWDYIGLLDDFRIYNKALSSTEVSELFNCGGSTISNLVAYYDFETGYGNMSGAMNNMINPWNTDVPTQNCTVSLTNVNGCDSTAVLNLTINNSDTSYTNVTACDSYTWIDGNTLLHLTTSLLAH